MSGPYGARDSSGFEVTPIWDPYGDEEDDYNYNVQAMERRPPQLHGTSESNDDEALARALQEEYEFEYLRSQQQRQQQSHLRGSSRSAPVVPPRSSRSIGESSATTGSSGTNDTSRSRTVVESSAPPVRMAQGRGSTRHVERRRPASPPPPRLSPGGGGGGSRNVISYEIRAHDTVPRSVATSSSRVNPTAPPPPPPVPPPAPTLISAKALSDEEYARRLDLYFRSRGNSAESHRTMSTVASSTAKSSGSSSPVTLRSDSFASDTAAKQAQAEEDEYVARRVSQEEEDEVLARKLALEERQRLAVVRGRTPDVAHNPSGVAVSARARGGSQNRNKGCCRRLICYTLPMVVIILSAAAIVYYFYYGVDGMPTWMPNPEQFANEDPFAMQDPSQVSRWRNRGQGLELQVINALDENWFPFFYTAVSDWDNGDPDTLTLRTSQMNPDPNCPTVAGTLKVCNGNYGETFWRGINKLLLENNFIYASSARMNEFYFYRDQRDVHQRQYTMCHEIGHGFGLPHTDEDFHNADLGNCMDYTNRPQNNKQPDRMNFEFLKELYGVVPGSGTVTEEQSNSPQQQQQYSGGENAATTAPVEEARKEKKNKNNNNRNLHVRRAPRNVTSRKEDDKAVDTVSRLPHHISRALNDVDVQVDRGLSEITIENGWKLLHRSSHGEAHEKDLGDGFKVQVHLLRA